LCVKDKRLSISALLLGLLMLGVSFVTYDVESKLFWMCRMVFVPLFLFAIWSLMPAVRLPHCLSSVSFQIFLLHIIVWRVIDGVANACGINFSHPESLLGWWWKWAIGFIVPIWLSIVLRRAFPKFSRIAFGGR
jgi:hypothetical protein